MNLFEVTTEEELAQLKGMYQSEGFGIYLRLLDSIVGQLYNKTVDDKTSDSDIVNNINKIKGVALAKNACFNAIKESENKLKEK